MDSRLSGYSTTIIEMMHWLLRSAAADAGHVALTRPVKLAPTSPNGALDIYRSISSAAPRHTT